MWPDVPGLLLGFVALFLRSEKLQNKSFPNFWNFRPGFCSEFCSEFSPNFSRTFRASFRGRRRPEKIHQKSPPFFNAKFPGKHEKKLFTKFFWRAGKVTFPLPVFKRRFASSTRLHLSGPVLRDTARLSQRYPPIARYGVLGVSTWPIGCDTPSPFSERFPLGEHAKWRCDTPPRPKKGYLSGTGASPAYENKANGCDTPPLRYYLERVLRDMGGYLALGR